MDDLRRNNAVKEAIYICDLETGFILKEVLRN